MENHSFALSGFARNNGATAPETLIGLLFSILVRAPISPVGVLMNFTAEESAAYSRFLEIANWTKATIIGARIARAIPIIIRTTLLFSLSWEPPIDDQNKLLKKISEIIAIIPTRTAVRVMKRMS